MGKLQELNSRILGANVLLRWGYNLVPVFSLLYYIPARECVRACVYMLRRCDLSLPFSPSPFFSHRPSLWHTFLRAFKRCATWLTLHDNGLCFLKCYNTGYYRFATGSAESSGGTSWRPVPIDIPHQLINIDESIQQNINYAVKSFWTLQSRHNRDTVCWTTVILIEDRSTESGPLKGHLEEFE